MKFKIGIIDDQQLFLKSLATLINTFKDFEVVVEALNGKEFIQKMELGKYQLDIVIVDVTMPVMNGPETAGHITSNFPAIKTVALSMKDDDDSVLKMIKGGCCAYLLKDIHPVELEKALLEIRHTGHYNADVVNINYRRIILKSTQDPLIKLSEREKTFLQMACSDLTYQQIANKMYLSEKTIDGYRASLFEKFHVKSRVGLALEAVRLNLVPL